MYLAVCTMSSECLSLIHELWTALCTGIKNLNLFVKLLKPTNRYVIFVFWALWVSKRKELFWGRNMN